VRCLFCVSASLCCCSFGRGHHNPRRQAARGYRGGRQNGDFRGGRHEGGIRGGRADHADDGQPYRRGHHNYGRPFGRGDRGRYVGAAPGPVAHNRPFLHDVDVIRNNKRNIENNNQTRSQRFV